jgi:hypothetical protein
VADEDASEAESGLSGFSLKIEACSVCLLFENDCLIF